MYLAAYVQAFSKILILLSISVALQASCCFYGYPDPDVGWLKLYPYMGLHLSMCPHPAPSGLMLLK